ncbi:MAG: peptidase U32 family protein [Christensenellaceae bacterium]|jgi:putative protease
MNRVELLAPAGNRECLKTAFYFGADAVYIAGKQFGLRAFAANFSEDEIREAVAQAHKARKKIYVTVNAVMFSNELEGLARYLEFLADADVDGAIVSDPAAVALVQARGIELDLHLSTQANTTNYLSAQFWHNAGVKRIVLSREVPLEDVRIIRDNTPEKLEIEAFVHGAMCIAHSGRCLLSSATTGRSGNKGACAQPCRWEYYLHEKGYDGEYFQISEDERGTYILNSRDLMMIEHIPELIGAGISSFKIEGRMKSAYYVASVVSAYRRAIDAYYKNPAGYVLPDGIRDELVKSATRGFTTGFYFGNPREAGQDTERTEELRKYTFAAKVVGSENGRLLVEQRNKFCTGDRLEVLSPSMENGSFVVEEIVNEAGEAQQSAPHPQQHVYIDCPYPLQKGDLLRRED